MTGTRNFLIWAALGAAVTVPIVLAFTSPLLAWRDPIYILAGFAGIVAMELLLVQPLLVAGCLPGLSGFLGRRAHRWVGGGLVGAVVIHVAALWVTSPPDVIDALLLASPAPFSIWGVIAMWAVFVTALIAFIRRYLDLKPQTWRRIHTMLAAVIIVTSAIHAMLIEGTMEVVSKAILSILVVTAMLYAFSRLRVWASWSPRKPNR